MGQPEKTSTRAADAVGAAMRGGEGRGEGGGDEGGSRRGRRGGRGRGGAAEVESPREEAPAETGGPAKLAPEQRLQAVEAELKASMRERAQLKERVDNMERRLKELDEGAESEQVRVLRAQVDDLTTQVADLRENRREYRFGISFSLMGL